MKILLSILLILFSIQVEAKQIFIRDDGGIPVTECDGTKDLPKQADKHCAYSKFYGVLTATSTSNDNIVINKGQFAININPPSIYVSMTQFMANPKYYTDSVAAGRTVYINNYNGRNFQIVLKQ